MITRLDPELIATAVPFVLLTLDALRRYLKDEEVTLHELPWLEFRSLFEYARRKFFTIDRPDKPSFVVDYTLEELTRELGTQGVKPGHKFSYRYRGEIYNAVMYVFDPSDSLPHRQIHIRAFEHPDGLEIMAHAEPHWYSHPVAHLKSNDMEHDAANLWVQQRLHEHIPVGYPAD